MCLEAIVVGVDFKKQIERHMKVQIRLLVLPLLPDSQMIDSCSVRIQSVPLVWADMASAGCLRLSVRLFCLLLKERALLIELVCTSLVCTHITFFMECTYALLIGLSMSEGLSHH